MFVLSIGNERVSWKNGLTIGMPFWVVGWVGPGHPILDWGLDKGQI